jgi:hypothetical protein
MARTKKINQEPCVNERPKDARLKEIIRNRANYSLAVLGMAFVRNGSGRFLNIRASHQSILGGR